MISRLILIFIFVIISFNCKPNTVGPCEHIFKEPILHIESVANSNGSGYVQTIILSKIMLDTINTDPRWLTPISKNVVFLDSTLICNLPCSFGYEQHRYSFTVSAKGYYDTTIVCYPNYSINKGGCPSSSDGGLRIRFSMRQK
jgi:hypothetical protein